MAGRRGSYEDWLTEDKLFILESWAREGLTDGQIAHNIGINPSVLSRWKKAHPQIGQALKKGKEVTDYIVENELYQSTKTRTIIIKKPVKLKTKKQIQGKGTIEEERIEYVEEEIVVPANVTAQIFWLKNRKADRWRDKPMAQGYTDTSGREQFLAAIDQKVDEEYISELYKEEGE